MTELQLYLERQPAITKRFESDQLELIETIERAGSSPDYWLVDFERNRSMVSHARNIAALRRCAFAIKRGVLVNVGGD
jgi:hypothetical protein